MLHSQVYLLLPKEGQWRWVPWAAQEMHSHSCQGLEEQRRYWLCKVPMQGMAVAEPLFFVAYA